MGRFVIISMMVLCDAIVSLEHDRRSPGLSRAPLDVE